MSQISKLNFEDRFVAFIDIMGFKDFIQSPDFKAKAEKNFEIIEEAVSKGTVKSSHGIYPSSDITSTVISDSLILSIPFDPSSDWREKIKVFRFLISAVEKIQFNLSIENIWTRGAISSGELSHNSYNVIGQGLVNAYLLEQQATFPRVLVDPNTVKLVFSDNTGIDTKAGFLNDINTSWGNPNYSGKFIFDWEKYPKRNQFNEDYPFFIHYMNSLIDQENQSERDQIFENLKSKIYQNNPSIYQKYRWVADYLISFVCMHNTENHVEDFHTSLKLL